MTRWTAFRGLLVFALLVRYQCLVTPGMRTAWVVMTCAFGLSMVTAGAAILLSGHYRSK